MARVRITTTTDATTPRTVHLGGGIVWYAYLRPTARLYIQREQDGVRDPEVFVTTPVMALDVIRAPLDPSIGWVYFVHDGIVQKIQVTPTTAVLNAVAFARIDAWTQNAQAGGGIGLRKAWTTIEYPPLKFLKTEDVGGRGGVGLRKSWVTDEGPQPPTLSYERYIGLSTITLFFTLPDRSAFKNRGITEIHVLRKETEIAGFQPYATVLAPTYPPDPRFPPPLTPSLVVPGTVVPVTTWAATCARTGYLPSESIYSNTLLDNGALPVTYAEFPSARGGIGLRKSWSTTEYPPIKTLKTETVGGTTRGPGGIGLRKSWVLNGTEIIRP